MAYITKRDLKILTDEKKTEIVYRKKNGKVQAGIKIGNKIKWQ
jgi:hypothetical protein